MKGRQRKGRGGRLWLITHRWIGIVAALPLWILAVTGCILAFKPELQAWSMPGIYHVRPQGEAASAEEVFGRIRQAWPETHLAHTKFPHAPDEPYLAFANRPDPDGEGREGFRLLVNPYTLEMHRQQGRGGWVGWIETLHRNLVMGKVGRWVTAISSAVLVGLLISGLTLWWPIRRGTLRRLRQKGHALAWHNVVGLISSPVVLLLAVTGASFHFGWAIFPMVETVTASASPAEKPASQSATSESTLPPAEAVARAREYLGPTDRIAALGMPGGKEGVIQVHVAQKGALNQYGWRRMYLDRASGALLGRENYWQQGMGAAYRRSFWAWHSGIFLGLSGRLVWALGSGASAALVVTGIWWWWRKQMPVK